MFSRTFINICHVHDKNDRLQDAMHSDLWISGTWCHGVQTSTSLRPLWARLAVIWGIPMTKVVRNVASFMTSRRLWLKRWHCSHWNSSELGIRWNCNYLMDEERWCTKMTAMTTNFSNPRSHNRNYLIDGSLCRRRRNERSVFKPSCRKALLDTWSVDVRQTSSLDR